MRERMLNIDDQIKKETVSLAQRLIRIPSMNPPGNEDQIADFVQGFLEDAGIESVRIPLEKGRSSIVARIPGKNSGSIVLCGHLDTVRADAAEWHIPPFSGEIRDDRLYGLGAADMKSGVAVILQIARELVRQGITPEQDIVLALTADEEHAYRGAATIAESGLIDNAKFLLILEPTGGKGYIGQKGELWVEATFTGKAAHGSVPEFGVNTILPAARFCTDLSKASSEFPAVSGRGRTSLNIGKIDGGTQVNIVPAQTVVRIDSRTVSQAARDEVLGAIERLGNEAAQAGGARFSMKVLNDKAPIVSDPQDPWIRRFLGAVYPGEEVAPEIASGPAKGEVVHLDPMLREYYEARGYDWETGYPTRAALESVGLKDVADELQKIGKCLFTASRVHRRDAESAEKSNEG